MMKWKITDTDPTVYENLVQEEDRTSNSKYYITQYMILEKLKKLSNLHSMPIQFSVDPML